MKILIESCNLHDQNTRNFMENPNFATRSALEAQKGSFLRKNWSERKSVETCFSKVVQNLSKSMKIDAAGSQGVLKPPGVGFGGSCGPNRGQTSIFCSLLTVGSKILPSVY